MPMLFLIEYFLALPFVIQCSSYFYLGSLLVYNTATTYQDSKEYLMRYRRKQLNNEYERSYIKDDWHAVKYGAWHNFRGRFFRSLIWPLTSIADFIPAVVLYMNPNTDDE